MATRLHVPVVVFFAQVHVDFTLAEFDSCIQMAGLKPEDVYDRAKADIAVSPFVVCRFETEELLRAVVSRCVLVLEVLELWGEGATYEQVFAGIKALPDTVTGPRYAPTASWGFSVTAYGKAMPDPEQARIRNQFSFMGMQGPVHLKRPDTQFRVIEDWSHIIKVDWRIEAEAANPDQYHESKLVDEEAQKAPRYIYFGRFICEGNRSTIHKYILRKRPYLGPTSMDTEVALVMANMAQIKPGHLVFDPFCGTGSILVAMAAFGAIPVGGDIDMRILKGKGGKNIYTNFNHYGLPWPELFRFDNSLRCIRQIPLFHSIVCDPPYGVRAGARKSGVENPKNFPSDRSRTDTFPRTSVYEAVDVMRDLLDLAARMLIMGGRLVYLLPTCAPTYTDADVPMHPCLRVVSNNEQRMQMILSRRLITMEKIAEFDVSKIDEYNAAITAHDALSVSYSNIVDQRQKIIAEAASSSEASSVASGSRRAPSSGGAAGGAPAAGSADVAEAEVAETATAATATNPATAETV